MNRRRLFIDISVLGFLFWCYMEYCSIRINYKTPYIPSSGVFVSKQRGLFECEYEVVGKEEDVMTNRKESYIPEVKLCFLEKDNSIIPSDRYMLVTEFEGPVGVRLRIFSEKDVRNTDTLRVSFAFPNGARGTLILVKNK